MKRDDTFLWSGIKLQFLIQNDEPFSQKMDENLNFKGKRVLLLAIEAKQIDYLESGKNHWSGITKFGMSEAAGQCGTGTLSVEGCTQVCNDLTGVRIHQRK